MRLDNTLPEPQHPDDFGIRRPLPAFIVKKDAHGRPIDPARDLDEAAERVVQFATLPPLPAEQELAEMDLARQRRGPQEIALLALGLTYGEMVEMVAAIGNVAAGKLDGVDLAPILWAWAHKTRGAAP